MHWVNDCSSELVDFSSNLVPGCQGIVAKCILSWSYKLGAYLFLKNLHISICDPTVPLASKSVTLCLFWTQGFFFIPSPPLQIVFLCVWWIHCFKFWSLRGRGRGGLWYLISTDCWQFLVNSIFLLCIC